jgi:hypothetical protein
MERILPKEIVDDLTKPGKAFLGYGVPNPKVNDMPEEPLRQPGKFRRHPAIPPTCHEHSSETDLEPGFLRARVRR